MVFLSFCSIARPGCRCVKNMQPWELHAGSAATRSGGPKSTRCHAGRWRDMPLKKPWGSSDSVRVPPERVLRPETALRRVRRISPWCGVTGFRCLLPFQGSIQLSQVEQVGSSAAASLSGSGDTERSLSTAVRAVSWRICMRVAPTLMASAMVSFSSSSEVPSCLATARQYRVHGS